MNYLNYIYELVKLDTMGMDAVYKDYIIKLVGERGFEALHEAKLIEGCGSVNLRELYVICEKR